MTSPQCRTDRPPAAGPFPGDAMLRKHGFSIVDRPRGRPAVWVRSGCEYQQPEAVTICELEDDAKGGKT